MTNKAKRARFRQLAQQDGIRTGQQFAEEHEQPCFNFVAEAERTQPGPPGYMLIDDIDLRIRQMQNVLHGVLSPKPAR
jgi:hypothetical protein